MRHVMKGGYDDTHLCTGAQQNASFDENEYCPHHGSIAALHHGRSSIDGAKFTRRHGLSMFGFRLKGRDKKALRDGVRRETQALDGSRFHVTADEMKF